MVKQATKRTMSCYLRWEKPFWSKLKLNLKTVLWKGRMWFEKKMFLHLLSLHFSENIAKTTPKKFICLADWLKHLFARVAFDFTLQTEVTKKHVTITPLSVELDHLNSSSVERSGRVGGGGGGGGGVKLSEPTFAPWIYDSSTISENRILRN